MPAQGECGVTCSLPCCGWLMATKEYRNVGLDIQMASELDPLLFTLHTLDMWIYRNLIIIHFLLVFYPQN